MSAKRAKPVRAWAVVSPRNRIIEYTVHRNLQGCLNRMLSPLASLKQDGYRIARVTVTEDIP